MDEPVTDYRVGDTVVHKYFKGWYFRGTEPDFIPYIYIDEWFLEAEITGALHEFRNLRRWKQYDEADKLKADLLLKGLQVDIEPNRAIGGGVRLYLHYPGWKYVILPNEAMGRKPFFDKYYEEYEKWKN